MKNRKHIKWGFTLVEMLIVIVIIGILAAALIPRLASARGRANDTARKADLQQIATALITYQIDKGTFPTSSGSISAINQQLLDVGMNSVPTDPDSSSTFTWLVGPSVPWQFEYIPLKKNGSNNGWFLLMAKTETEGGSNFVFCASTSEIGVNSDYASTWLNTCDSFTGVSSPSICNAAACTYVKWNGELRYIYKY